MWNIFLKHKKCMKWWNSLQNYGNFNFPTLFDFSGYSIWIYHTFLSFPDFQFEFYSFYRTFWHFWIFNLNFPSGKIQLSKSCSEYRHFIHSLCFRTKNYLFSIFHYFYLILNPEFSFLYPTFWLEKWFFFASTIFKL